MKNIYIVMYRIRNMEGGIYQFKYNDIYFNEDGFLDIEFIKETIAEYIKIDSPSGIEIKSISLI